VDVTPKRARAQVRRRTIGGVAVLAVTAGLLVGLPIASGAAPTPPPNPTDHQLDIAKMTKQQLATQVGQLSAQVASMQAEVKNLEGKAEFAEQKYTYSLSQLQDAKAAARRTAKAVVKAQQTVEAAQRTLVSYVAGTYMSGDSGDSTESLLTASDPNALLERGALEAYQTDHQLDAVGSMQRATLARTNADVAAKKAKAKQAKATAAADTARKEAAAAVAAARAQQAQLQQQMASTQTSLNAANLQLATLNNQRANYIAYQKEQARLRAIAAEKARKQREAEARRARQLREQQQQQQQQNNNGGGGGSSSSGGGNSSPITASGGSWSQGWANEAVSRAMSQRGTPYAWAGGNSGGPTYGVCDPSNGAPNDCHVYGYDCSGLVMYAWGPHLSLPHYAASQYHVAGSFHPSASQLRPGDLVFWSYNGSSSGIHHVAIYIGSGQIVEAPYSGSYVRVASLYEYGSFYGATRPMS
jgi:cell wall-associated NlpC family hydrolase